MNEHDSERISGILEGQGYQSSENAENADLVILNTCSIREKAEQKFFSELGRLRSLKGANPGMTIAVAGCIAQQEGAGILSKAPYVDLVFGPSDIGHLSDMTARRGKSPLVNVGGDPDYHRKRLPARRTGKLKAWVSIMYGCDNFCTYCVVPYLRGRERSRTPQDIVGEVSELAGQGYKEITLLGQNVNSYGKGLAKEMDFPELLHMVNGVAGIERIRFVTSHPKDLSDRLIAAMRDLPKVCKALHLPVQSGSDRILAAMNRRYTHGEYLDKVKALRQAMPDIVLTTDIIAGFPGETEEDFDLTMQLLADAKFDGIFAFKYSKRPGTAALKLQGHLDASIKEDRLSRVLQLQNPITLQKNREYIGRTLELLLEGNSKKGTTLTGRTRGNKAVNVSAPHDLIGSLVNVLITGAGANSLSGRLCE